MSRIGEIATSIFAYIFFAALIGSCGYIIYDMSTRKPEKKSEHFACAIETYFDKDLQNYSTEYVSIMVIGDTITWIPEGLSNYGSHKKDFVSKAIFNDNKTEVTLKDGSVFKFEYITHGECQSDKKMDSIQSHEDDEDN